MTVYVVITLRDGRVVECEILDQVPQWDWRAMGQVVRVGNINGGDSVPVVKPDVRQEKEKSP